MLVIYVLVVIPFLAYSLAKSLLDASFWCILYYYFGNVGVFVVANIFKDQPLL